MNVLIIDTIYKKVSITLINTSTKMAKHIIIPLKNIEDYIFLLSIKIHSEVDIILLDLTGYGLYIKDLLVNKLDREDYNKIIDYKSTLWRINDEI